VEPVSWAYKPVCKKSMKRREEIFLNGIIVWLKRDVDNTVMYRRWQGKE